MKNDCNRCSGEYCDTHFAEPCDCDCFDRHISGDPCPNERAVVRNDEQAAYLKKRLADAKLEKFAARHPPPQSWYDEDHTGLV